MAASLGYLIDVDRWEREISREAERFCDMADETKKRAHLCKHGLYIKLQ